VVTLDSLEPLVPLDLQDRQAFVEVLVQLVRQDHVAIKERLVQRAPLATKVLLEPKVSRDKLELQEQQV